MDATCACPHCGQKIEFEAEHAGSSAPCPTCGKNLILSSATPPAPAAIPTRAMPQMPNKTALAKLTRKTEFAGVGAAVQAAGVLACFFMFPVGLIVGILLLIIGGRMAIKFYCGNCGNRVENKQVKMCPVCHSTLTN